MDIVFTHTHTACTHTHTACIYTHTQTHTLKLTHSLSHTLSLSFTHTLSLSHSLTLSRTLSLSFTHTHTLSLSRFSSVWTTYLPLQLSQKYFLMWRASSWVTPMQSPWYHSSQQSQALHSTKEPTWKYAGGRHTGIQGRTWAKHLLSSLPPIFYSFIHSFELFVLVMMVLLFSFSM